MSETPQDDAAFESLVLRAVERMQAEGPDAIDAICEANPDRAEALRSAIAPLAAIGLTSSESPEEAHPLGPGRTFAQGEFEIVREIGRGGMGVVFEAHQSSLDRRVALKLLARPLELDPTAVQRFEREARIAASLHHPGIAEVFAFGVDQGIHYLAMELVEGTPLDELIRSTRQVEDWEQRARVLPPEGTHDNFLRAALELVERIATALDYAHTRGIVHRDIKPSNVIVRGDGTPVVTDFGLAQNVDLPGLTRTGAFVGTPHYTAPEQHGRSGSAEIDGRADVFSLGVTLYELVTDRRPFGGETTQDVLHSVATIEPPDPQLANPKLPMDVSSIILKALEKETTRRYASAGELAEDLRAFLEFRPIRAKRAGTTTKIRRWVRREPLRAAFFVLLLVAIPAVAALVGYIVANRPLVTAAERQAALDRAEAALISAMVVESPDLDEQEARLKPALTHPATRTEALVVQMFSSLATDPEYCLEVLDRYPFEDSEPRAVRRLRALGARLRGAEDEANGIEDALGPPATAMEHLVVGKWVLEQGHTRHKHDRSSRAIEHLQIAAMLSQSPRPTVLRHLAMVAGDLSREPLARGIVDAVMAEWPNEAFAWETKGLAFESIDPDAAIAAYERALELVDESARPRVLSNLGQLHCKQYHVEEAQACFDEVIRIAPRRTFLHACYAYLHLYRECGEVEDALPHAEIAIETAKSDADLIRALRLRIRTLADLGRAEEAVQRAEEALERVPGTHAIYSDLLSALASTEDWDRVLAKCEELLEVAPDRGAVLATRAEALAGLGRLDDAVADLVERARLSPKNAMVWHTLSLMAMRRGADGGPRVDADLALDACRRSNTLAGEGDPFMTITYATILLDFREFDECQRLLDHSAELLTQSRWSRYESRLQPKIEERRERLAELRAGTESR